MNDSLETLFCLVDDFCQAFLPFWHSKLLESGSKKRNRRSYLSVSEIMTLLIHFHQSNYRTFKHYYLQHVCRYLRSAFPGLVSYTRMVTLTKSVIGPLLFFLQTLTGEQTGIYFIDSTLLKVCHIKREKQHKVFKGLAQKARSTIGWFFGFKLHLVINEKGELMAFKVTRGNVDDRKPVPDLVKGLVGKLIGDKGYLSQPLFEQLYEQGLQLITKIKKNMKNKLMPIIDKVLLRKRAIIESVNDQLKNISQIEHTRHRSPWNFIVNLLCGLCAYALQPKKPSMNLKYKRLLEV
jgi:hypothetical protein